MLIATIQLT